MKNKVRSFVESKIARVANSTGSTIASGSLVDCGGLGWGVVFADILDGAEGDAHTSGRYTFTKATGAGTDYAVGTTLFWDSGNSRVTTSALSRPLGTVTKKPATTDTVVELNLNEGPRQFIGTATGDASGGGLEVDTGLGVEITGAIIVQSRSSAGAVRARTSVVAGTGGDAGKITIVTGAGAAGDVHSILISQF